MMRVPRSALILGLAGLIPFLWGALTILVPVLGDWGARALGPPWWMRLRVLPTVVVAACLSVGVFF